MCCVNKNTCGTMSFSCGVCLLATVKSDSMILLCWTHEEEVPCNNACLSVFMSVCHSYNLRTVCRILQMLSTMTAHNIVRIPKKPNSVKNSCFWKEAEKTCFFRFFSFFSKKKRTSLSNFLYISRGQYCWLSCKYLMSTNIRVLGNYTSYLETISFFDIFQ